MTKLAYYPRCDEGHRVLAHDNGLPCPGCEEASSSVRAASEPILVAAAAYEQLDGPMGSFSIPASPDNTRDHARWIAEGVWAGEYDAPELADAFPDRFTVEILDIGAHVGAFAAWAEAKWPNRTHVTCYEPNEAAIPYLARNAPDASIVHAAVTSDPAPRFACAWDWGSAKTFGISADEGLPVASVHPVDLPPADVLKCDAEGVEIDVLTHYAHWDDLRVLMVEWHNLEHREALLEIAESHGFTMLREQAQETYGSSVWIRQ